MSEKLNYDSIKLLFKFIRHKAAHALSLQEGRVHTWYDENDDLWIAFKCDTCNKIEEAEKVKDIFDKVASERRPWHQ